MSTIGVTIFRMPDGPDGEVVLDYEYFANIPGLGLVKDRNNLGRSKVEAAAQSESLRTFIRKYLKTLDRLIGNFLRASEPLVWVATVSTFDPFYGWQVNATSPTWSYSFDTIEKFEAALNYMTQKNASLPTSPGL